MAGALKQSFVEAVRLTPDGIAAFLETPLPEAPTITTPADVDAATIACGVLSKYLLDLFAAFNGLTPVELLLRIGQHNSVLESAMIAGLEYIEGGDPAERDVAFTEPAAGQSYMPGEMRFVVTVKNGVPDRVEIVVDDGSPYKMASEDGQTWTYYQTVSDAGEHSAQASALFATETQTASVSFTIEDYDPDNPPTPPPETPPEPPGGTDKEALNRLKTAVEAAYRYLVSFGNVGDPDEYKSRMTAFLSAVSQFLGAVTITSTTITECRSAIATHTGLINTILGNPEISTGDIDNATNAATKILNNINMIYNIAV